MSNNIPTAGISSSGSITHQQPLNITSVYKQVKASIAFVLMIIAATGWCV